MPPDLDDQPGEDVDQRRLARAVGAEQAEDLAARHIEADPVERALRLGALGPIGLAQVLDADCGLDVPVMAIRIAVREPVAKAELVND